LTAITLRCDLLEQAVKRFVQEGIGNPFAQIKVVLEDGRRPKGKSENIWSEEQKT
jgi:hypothetical protein